MTRPIACDLGALDAEGRRRRAELAARVASSAQSVEETADGYALRLAAADALCRDALEWILLERACCPFLRFALRFEPGAEALRLELGGEPGAKEFLAAAGLRERAASVC
jgi:hypothetical protein